MSSLLTWKINNVDLDAGSLGFIVEPSMWRPPISLRNTEIVLPTRHGSIIPDLPTFDAPLLTLSVWRAASQTNIEAATNALVALLTQPSLTLTRESGGIVASAPADLQSMSFDNFVVDSTSRATAVLKVPGVFFRGNIVTSADINFTADFDSVAVAALDGSTAPIADPIIRILGPVTNPIIRNPTSGTSIGYTGTVPAGTYLFIRLDNLSARTSTTSTDWNAGGTTVTQNLTYAPRGILQLWPAISGDPFTRPVLLSGTGTGKTSAARVTVQAAKAYL